MYRDVGWSHRRGLAWEYAEGSVWAGGTCGRFGSQRFFEVGWGISMDTLVGEEGNLMFSFICHVVIY